MKEYVIVGDTKNYNGCLVCLGGTSYKRAEEILERMKNNPNDNDKRLISGHTNLRIEEVDEMDCWWNFGCD